MKTILYGIGNSFRGDDAAGIEVANTLLDRGASPDQILSGPAEIAQLIDLMEKTECLIFVDCVYSGQEIGTIHKLDLTKEKLPYSKKGPSTHIFGLGEALDMAKALDIFPKKIWFWGIEGRNFEFSRNISHEVQAGIRQVSSEINEILN